MDKNQAIKLINEAKRAHVNQMHNVKLLFQEGNLEAMTAVRKSNCKFESWLNGSTFNVKKILGEQVYTRLDMNQDEWYRDYLEIYKIFFNRPKQNFFSRLLGQNSINPIEMEMAKFYHERLAVASHNLINTIESSKRRVLALPSSKFK